MAAGRGCLSKRHQTKIRPYVTFHVRNVIEPWRLNELSFTHIEELLAISEALWRVRWQIHLLKCKFIMFSFGIDSSETLNGCIFRTESNLNLVIVRSESKHPNKYKCEYFSWWIMDVCFSFNYKLLDGIWWKSRAKASYEYLWILRNINNLPCSVPTYRFHSNVLSIYHLIIRQ